MSTDLGADPGAVAPLAGIQDLTSWFAAGSKPRSRWGIGLEYERLGVFADSGRAIPYSGERSVSSLLEALVEQCGWTALRENGAPIALSRGETHLTLEPGGQTELSSRIHQGLGTLRDELCEFLVHLGRISEQMGIAWLGMGLQPFSLRDDIPWIPKARYGIMSAALGKTGRLAHDMMKRTAGIQVNFDYEGEEDAAAKFRALMGVSPLITALFANSPLSGGEPTGYMSTRAAIWRDTDPARSGLLELAFSDAPFFQSYLDYALDVPMLFVNREGRWLPVPVPFRRFLREGHQGLKAQRGDWSLHLTTLFPDVRMKQFLEARFADSGDASLALAQAALIKGIVYDDEATREAWELVARMTWKERLDLHEEVCRLGLQARASGQPVLELARQLTRVAAAGLRRQTAAGGEDEESLLAPLEVILGDGESPARRILRLWDSSMRRDPQQLVAHLSQVNLACYDT